MRFKKIALALFACLALGAFAASTAQAAEGEGWTINGVAIPSGTHQRVKCAKHGSGKLTFTGSFLGSAVEITANQVDCLEQAGSTNAATIDNTTSKGHSEGVLTFTEVEVLKPENCEVVGKQLTTKALTDEVIMDPGGGGAVFDRFVPEIPVNGIFAIQFGGKCAISENTAVMKGAACGEAVHTNTATPPAFVASATGENRAVQSLRFGEPQQKTGNSEKSPAR
jgi:hypothetical protein